VVALNLTEVVDLVVFEELVDVTRRNLALTFSVDSFEGSPRFETFLLSKLLSLLLNDSFIFTDSLEQQVNFEASALSQHNYFSN